MRVIAGKAKGTQLLTPDGILTRPTIDRVKEALFSILQFDLPGARVLDLFGGTGQLGIEALSRGAESAVFVDARREACQLIRANLQKTRLEQSAPWGRSFPGIFRAIAGRGIISTAKSCSPYTVKMKDKMDII